jgi:hypothetical protein
MNDEELLAQAANVQTVYFDGLGAFRKINGVLRCVGYIIGGGAQMNLLISLTGAEAANTEVRRVLDQKRVRNDPAAERLRLAH